MDSQIDKCIRAFGLKQRYIIEENPRKTFEMLERINQTIFSNDDWKTNSVEAYDKISDINLDFLAWRMEKESEINKMYMQELKEQGITEGDVLEEKVLIDEAIASIQAIKINN
jgi:hypothetical protein